MKTRILAASIAATSLLLASASLASADTLSVSCSGVPSASSITWTAASGGGVAPVAFLWGNGSTLSVQTASYSPGLQTITIQGTDASSTVANSSCSATIATPVLLPSISSFTATPSSVSLGGSSVLAWTVSNASSTSLNHGIGTVSSTSITVSPSVTTTYTLSAINPNNTVTANATVTVGTSTSGTGGGVQARISALLQQIAGLKLQIAQLIAASFGGTLENPPFIPPGQIGKIACIELGRDLHHGDRGDDVMKLQVMLRWDSENGFTAAPNGIFGPLTKKAMMKFQKRMGIASSTDGSVGPLTRGFFNRACGKGLIKHGDDTANASSTKKHENENNDHKDHNATSSKGHGNDKGDSQDD